MIFRIAQRPWIASQELLAQEFKRKTLWKKLNCLRYVSVNAGLVWASLKNLCNLFELIGNANAMKLVTIPPSRFNLVLPI